MRRPLLTHLRNVAPSISRWKAASPIPQSRLREKGLDPTWARLYSTTRILGQHAKSKIQLRPYQQESIDAALGYLARGEKRLGISLATGSGKTVIFSHLLDQVPAPTPHATQTLILAHRRELVDQAARHCRELYPDKTVDIEMGKKHASGVADITVASVPTLKSPQRLMRFDPDRFKLILVDEAHHTVATSYLNILKHFRLSDKCERGPTAVVGVSATFSRHDGLKLGAAIDHIVYHKDYVDMIHEKWLSDVIFTTVRTGVNLSKVRVTGGDFQTGALSKAVNNDETNAITVRAWLEKAGQRKSTLGFCVDLAHVTNLTAMFRQHGIDARFITGDTPTKQREQRLDDFKAGGFPVLLNCGIFTEGTDIPNVDCILLARPTQSRNLLVQMVGRGLRKHAGKQNCHVIDMVASLEAGIVTTPTLFGLDPEELVKGADIKEMASLGERKEMEKQRVEQALNTSGREMPELKGEITFTDYDDVNDLIQDTSGERQIRALSRYAWVQIDEGRYVLSNRDGSYMTIKKDEAGDRFIISYTPKLPPSSGSKVPFARTREVGKAMTFEDAVHGGDKFASETFQFDFIATWAYWRKTWASEGQLSFLNKFREQDQKLEAGSITKGRAADWITKFKHGARGRFERMLGQKRKAEKKVAMKSKWRERQQHQQVQVGPVAA
ncbi:ATP-dependent helicase IRC3 [Lecanosticta acicola]|uniref:ATP-dependent helicase IRC3 n=1 Tax=Lecanosticta acicola TaxID=111012 RepID=A0AAI8YX12_9PEZI|nr:ATP-dependent helicase IRC3 [Lecanosticta acicola]